MKNISKQLLLTPKMDREKILHFLKYLEILKAKINLSQK